MFYQKEVEKAISIRIDSMQKDLELLSDPTLVEIVKGEISKLEDSLQEIRRMFNTNISISTSAVSILDRETTHDSKVVEVTNWIDEHDSVAKTSFKDGAGLHRYFMKEPNQKLMSAQVRRIKRLHDIGKFTFVSIAALYNTTPKRISKLYRGVKSESVG